MSDEQTNEIKTTDTVTLSREQFASMMERIEKLEKGDSRPKVERPKYRTARIWFLDDEMEKMVIGYGKNRERQNEDGSRYLEMEVIYTYQGKEHSQYIPIVDFRNTGKSVEAKILERRNIGDTIITGYTNLVTVDYAAFRSTTSDLQVPMEVKAPIYIYKLQLPDGREVELHENALN